MNELLDVLIQGAALALLSLGTAGAGWLGPQIARWLRLSSDERIRAYLLQVVEVAVEYGQAEARRRLRSRSSFVTAEVVDEREKEAAVKIAAEYVEQRVPDALAHFEIGTPTLQQMIRARLPGPPPGGAG